MTDGNPQKSLRVLISGAGIGGLVAAYWLGKAGASVTVLERAKDLRKEGHIVGIRKEALPIINYMGLEEDIRRQMSHEMGLKLVDNHNSTWAAFPPGDLGFSCGVELRRGDLVKSLYERAKDEAHFNSGETINSIEETNECICVTLGDNAEVLQFDVLLVAEGLRSKTRARIFKEEVNTPISSLGLLAASFSYKSEDDWAYWYNIPDHRALLLRPDRFGQTRTLAMCKKSEEYTTSTNLVSSKTPVEQQKDFFIRRFKQTGWEKTGKIMRAMNDADDFYVLEMVQVKCKKWSRGRTVLLGDSAYCPSPFGGMGTTAAIIGAYSLAAKLVQTPGDHRSAFESYENSLRPWAESIQKPVAMTIHFGLPGTRMGIRFFHLLGFVVSLPLVSTILPFLIPFLVQLGLPVNAIAPRNPKPSVFQRI
ncbi:hypothetical protein PGT21_028737 [Puccinia graminis f. sp. tritici]|uniref:FAD-binding domain-containing protein n=1 Tax=Puccinia graminis f. sp. tritici TaxID=56615 RepID=A0A5B0RRY9_PUCGR|nr:hypothetical protein PGT21_028737 [Puccinia graminis f. sp. tritici]KAA1128337.1 hypothetical protein PGTUg99_010720 [Puccinia graminis f. sp. tritici]